jgi:uncharacterized protein YjbI with pentapeptide repeats
VALNNSNLQTALLSGATFEAAILTGVQFNNCDLSNVDLTDAACGFTDFTGATMPANADTKAEFKALVGYWNAATTIWTDGNPIG